MYYFSPERSMFYCFIKINISLMLRFDEIMQWKTSPNAFCLNACKNENSSFNVLLTMPFVFWQYFVLFFSLELKHNLTFYSNKLYHFYDCFSETKFKPFFKKIVSIVKLFILVNLLSNKTHRKYFGFSRFENFIWITSV